MMLPVITAEGSMFFLDSKTVFSVTLNGDRIEYKTVDNVRYYQPLAIEEVALFLKNDQDDNFHAADRKNLVNLNNVNYFNPETQHLQYNDSIKVEVSRINIKNIKQIKDITDVSEKKENGSICEYAPITRKRSLLNIGRV